MSTLYPNLQNSSARVITTRSAPPNFRLGNKNDICLDKKITYIKSIYFPCRYGESSFLYSKIDPLLFKIFGIIILCNL